MGRDQGWLAEHMLILGVTAPTGRRPTSRRRSERLRQDQFRDADPPQGFEGWQVSTIGDDIAWIKPHDDGRFYAINPEAGYFGVAPGTSQESNPNAMRMLHANVIFTNVALTDDGDVWWEGMTKEPPAHLTDWQGQSWTPGCGRKAAHPNARFTVSSIQCPSLDPHWDSPDGVPIGAFIFGGRRSDTLPLVVEAASWEDGVYQGGDDGLGDDGRGHRQGRRGAPRPVRDAAVLRVPRRRLLRALAEDGQGGAEAAQDLNVNWFRTDENGKFVWPGFGQNMRVLTWVVERCHGRGHAEETPLGLEPEYADLNWRGLDFPPERFAQVMKVDYALWKRELAAHDELFAKLGDKRPAVLAAERERLGARLSV